MPPQAPAKPLQPQTLGTPIAYPSSLIEDTAEHTDRVRAYGPDLFAPRTRDELREEADGMYRSGLLKKYLPREAGAWTGKQRYDFCTARAKEAMLAGADLRVLPRPAVRGFYFIDDQPYPSARLLVAAVRMRDRICEYWTVEEASDSRCTIVTKRRGAPKEARLTVTIDQFKVLRDERNYKGDGPKRPTWTLYPSRMLLARCSSWLANQEYADITMGLHAAEDMAMGAYERQTFGGDAPTETLVDEIMAMVDDTGSPPEAPPTDLAPASPPTGSDTIEPQRDVAAELRAELTAATTVEQCATLLSRASEIADEGARRAFAKDAAAKAEAFRKGAQS